MGDLRDPRGINYYSAFIQVAPDCPVVEGAVPLGRGEQRTMAMIQYELLAAAPYRYTQAELLFEAHAQHKRIPAAEREAAWEAFWAKPQACLRASPLPKKFGWGLHFDEAGRVALCPVESAAYREYAASELTQLKAMRSSRG